MTTTIAFANTNDAYLISGDNAYATALAGPADSISAGGDTNLFVGQQKSGTPYTVWQAFLEFGFTPSADSVPVSAYLRMSATSVTGTNVSRALEINKFDYGTLTTADWRTPAQLTTLYNSARLGAVANVQNAANLTIRAGHLNLTDVENAGTLRYVINSSRNRLQNTPTGLEYNGFRSADFSGTGSDPALFVAEVTDHVLNRDLGAQVQLSDGTHVFIEFTSISLGADGYTLKHRDLAGNVTTFNTATDQSVVRRGAQSHALARDSFDNVYVLSQSNTKNSLHCRGFIKGVGYTWTAGTARIGALPTFDNDINNIAMAWNPVGGTYGSLLAIVTHQAGSNVANEIVNVVVNCTHLINGSGSLFHQAFFADGFLILDTAQDGYNNFYNETGTLLDVSSPGTSGRGYLMSTSRHQVLGQAAGVVLATYELTADGTGYVTNTLYHDTAPWETGNCLKDANAKARILPITDTQFVTVTADPAAGMGLVIKHRQESGQIFTVAQVNLDSEGLTTMPAPSTLAASSAWDAIYNPLDNRVWLYYFDVANGRRLMRTHVDLNTGEAGQDQVEVNATVGATGSTNLAIRVQRGKMTGEQVLITVANRTSGAAHSNIYVADTINVNPSQPLLITKANFDATTSALFDWDFVDLNAGDTQSAFRLQIDNATTGATAWDTGKVVSGTSNYTLPASALTNEEDWRWRVMTWDSHDAESPWSDYGFFTTSGSGTVTITSPAIDNDPDIVTANTLVTWSVTGTTQAAYRVVVTRTSTGATIINTGYVSSTDTQYLVQGLLSDIEYNVAVTVRDAALVESNTANRLITPSYNRPEVPVISFDIQDDLGYIRLSITNPEPVGDRPNPTTNVVHRRVFNATNPNTPYQVLGSTTPNGTFLDFTAASGVLYEYRVRAVAGQFFSDSTPTQADRALELQGVWIHDPADAATTVKQFLYGKDARSTAIDTTATVQQFAGRTFPVTDFGEYELEDISLTVDIPHGPTHRTEEDNLRTFMEMKKTLFLRDNRGRAAYGTMSGYNQADQAWGVTVGFKFGRVSFDIEEV